MNAPDQLLEQVRAADPLAPADAMDWWRGPAARGLVGRVCFQNAVSSLPAPVRRRTAPIVAVALAASAGAAGVAFAAGLLGAPAPESVKAHLAELDRGMPADLRYRPDLVHARAVAESGSAVLYLADLADGGYCIEVASRGGEPQGASCVSAARLDALPLDVTAPIPASDSAPLVVGGRANTDRISTIQLRYADGSVAAVDVGPDHAWVVDVPSDQRQTAMDSGLFVTGRDRNGATVAEVHVPALRDDDPLGTAHDSEQPLVLSTLSDGTDLTRVRGIEGRVNLTPPVQLQMHFPDGTHADVDVAPDGTFRLLFPPGRQDEFSTAAGALVASRDGNVLASTPVYSVAYGRRHDGTR